MLITKYQRKVEGEPITIVIRRPVAIVKTEMTRWTEIVGFLCACAEMAPRDEKGFIALVIDLAAHAEKRRMDGSAAVERMQGQMHFGDGDDLEMLRGI
jgi:hypothetical protein